MTECRIFGFAIFGRLHLAARKIAQRAIALPFWREPENMIHKIGGVCSMMVAQERCKRSHSKQNPHNDVRIDHSGRPL
jgi:hypothetical protein